ncbi:hypothetical protein LJR022_000143 [Paraburkholderia hospita]|uniref:hypothetical protein n=1 Tax=Paraburkholderia hospita TaxID=169430 RepID=UPI003ECDB5AD
MNDLETPLDEAAINVTLWEVGRAGLNDAADLHMPLIVVGTRERVDLISALMASDIEGDIQYLYALPMGDIPSFGGAVQTSVAAASRAGLVFIAVDPDVESDLLVACAVSRAVRESGLFAVALFAQSAASLVDAHIRANGLRLDFDSVIVLRDAWPDAQALACNIIGQLAGGLKASPPVCTDLADVQEILRGAAVTVGIGHARGVMEDSKAGRVWDATVRAIRDVGSTCVETASGILVIVSGSHSVRLREIARAMHLVRELSASESMVIPAAFEDDYMGDGVQIMLLAAHRTTADRANLRGYPS